MTVFIKRYPSKGELPSKDGWYFTNRGLYFIYVSNLSDINECDYWLEEIELPSEEEIEHEEYQNFIQSDRNHYFKDGFRTGANFILNHLKSNTNESNNKI